MKKCYALLLLLISNLFQFALAEIPVADFYKEPLYRSVSLSPTGEYVAAIMPMPDRAKLSIIRLSDMKIMGTFMPESNQAVVNPRWVSDKRVIFNPASKVGRLEKPFLLPGLWAMDADGTKVKLFTGVSYILNGLPDDEDGVLIQYYNPVFKTTYGIQNTYTGEYTPSKQVSPVKGTKLNSAGYIANKDGKVLIFEAVRPATEEEVYFFRTSESEPWAQAYDEGITHEDLDFMGFSAGSRLAYFRKVNHSNNPDSVIAIDMRTLAVSEVAKDDNVSPDEAILSTIDGSVYAIRYLDGMPRYDYLHPDSLPAKDHMRLRDKFPGQDVLPRGSSKDGTKTLYLVTSDRNPGNYYIFDSSTGDAKLLFNTMPWINSESMAETRPIQFIARDGLAIEAFLTVPAGGRNAVPTIIYPHGGPFGEFDTWGFDPEVQLLASRGYAVMQVNYRGSGNYGNDFEVAGYRQWGKAMQDDLVDATQWLIKQGIADPNAICIYGASYGAYAALMGVARDPDLYACAIGNVGVYDLTKLLKDNSRQSARTDTNGWWYKVLTLKTIGDGGLEKISPVNLAASIQVPVLLAGGELDGIAPIAHTRQMQKALERAGNMSEMKIYYNEGHGSYLMENRVDWANRVLKFLDEHIGPKSGK